MTSPDRHGSPQIDGVRTACAYYRTSSASGVAKAGAAPEDDRDSLRRQQEAVRGYAARMGLLIVQEYYDAAVKGADHVMERPEFGRMVDYMMGNGARTVLVENAGRFARDLMVQLVGHDALKKAGIELIPVDAPGYFTEETETAVLIRQILGAVAQFEKNTLVRRMRVGRERKKAATGWCGGRRPVPAAHIVRAQELLALGTGLRAISLAMAAEGMLQQRSGKPYGPGSIKFMLNKGEKNGKA